ncbi:alpha/beta fold hydrolase [Frankia sp. R82]|uniref:alpha/beta fold hydrolase n=1 Tax=Frankia sp. R82 TaxID=2950553 RepID=UPI0020444660|nr:alpha/beta hydrolase [Frankia sp. R82]MCM3882722.1 alpha/beta hydrolase [Frankia sp. R82]
MVETRQWRIPVGNGLSLHVEQIAPDGGGFAGAGLTGVTGGSVGSTDCPVDSNNGPLVLVHGIAGSAEDWAAVATGLAASRPVVAYDHRGHGASGWACGGRSEYTFDLLFADLVAVLAALGPAPVDLLGHSMGGVIALRYALEHPRRVRSLILVDTAAAPANAPGPIARRLVGSILDKVSDTFAGRQHTDPAEPADADADADADSHATAEIEAVRSGPTPQQRAADGLGKVDPNALASFGRELGTYPSLVSRLGEIAVPTTVIVGEHDSSLRASARTMADSIPGARLAVIAGADHSPHASRPLAWLTAVDDHFARITDSRSADAQNAVSRHSTDASGFYQE